MTIYLHVTVAWQFILAHEKQYIKQQQNNQTTKPRTTRDPFLALPRPCCVNQSMQEPQAASNVRAKSKTSLETMKKKKNPRKKQQLRNTDETLG